MSLLIINNIYTIWTVVTVPLLITAIDRVQARAGALLENYSSYCHGQCLVRGESTIMQPVR